LRTVSLIAVIVLATGCVSLRPAYRVIPRGLSGDDKMLEAVRSLIPNGTPIAEAQRLMESAGFGCSRGEKEGSFTTRDKEWEDLWLGEKANSEAYSVDQSGLSYLTCTRRENPEIMMMQDWKVTLVHRDGKVVDARVSSYLTGP
jgi:hypothetical protein